tara:strand:- start:368 stop:469 length:102 start_codon:yes stop_codon:yes gene_type:complete
VVEVEQTEVMEVLEEDQEQYVLLMLEELETPHP